MAVTLRWNPIRMIVGRRRPAVVVGFVADEKVVDLAAERAEPKKRRRKPKVEENAVDMALALEPSPDEMPAIELADAKPMEAAAEEPKKRKKKTKLDEGQGSVDLALSLEPPPEEMPAIEVANQAPIDLAAEEPKK
jgi:hypothetical protein